LIIFIANHNAECVNGITAKFALLKGPDKNQDFFSRTSGFGIPKSQDRL